MSVPPAELAYTLFVERFPNALKYGWALLPEYPDRPEYAAYYYVSPPKTWDCVTWASTETRIIKWAGLEIHIPSFFWDDSVMTGAYMPPTLPMPSISPDPETPETEPSFHMDDTPYTGEPAIPMVIDPLTLPSLPSFTKDMVEAPLTPLTPSPPSSSPPHPSDVYLSNDYFGNDYVAHDYTVDPIRAVGLGPMVPIPIPGVPSTPAESVGIAPDPFRFLASIPPAQSRVPEEKCKGIPSVRRIISTAKASPLVIPRANQTTKNNTARFEIFFDGEKHNLYRSLEHNTRTELRVIAAAIGFRNYSATCKSDLIKEITKYLIFA